MKKISIFLVVMLIAFVSTSVAYAERGERGYKKNFNVADKVQRMQEKLNLNESQAQELEAIFNNAKAQKQECEAIDSRRAYKECKRSIKQRAHEEIDTILNDDQRIEFAEMKERKKERRKNRRDFRGE